MKVFCLNSGGCGSKYVVELLKANGIDGCVHEPKPDFNRLGVSFYAGKADFAKARAAVGETRANIFFESSNRLFSLARVLHDAYPEARFVHLHREGRDSVRSMRSNPEIGAIVRENRRFHEITRLPDDAEASDLARVCLYWSNVNDRILNDTAGLPLLSLRFDRLIAGDLDALAAFIGRDLPVRKIPQVNAKPAHAKRAPPFAEWPAEEQETFWRLCGKTMLMLGYS